MGNISAEDLAGLLPETDKQIEELHALLEFPADEVAQHLPAEAQEAEKRLPRVMTFAVSPEQETLIEHGRFLRIPPEQPVAVTAVRGRRVAHM